MKFWSVLPLLFVFFTPLAGANGETPYRGTMRAREQSTQRPISFSARVRPEGNIVITLTSKTLKNWASTIIHGKRIQRDEVPVTLYQGHVMIRGEKYPAAASVYGGKIRLSFPGRQRGSEGKQRVYTLTAPNSLSGNIETSIARVPQSIFQNKTCGEIGLGHAGHGKSRTVKPIKIASVPQKSYRVLTLSTEADPYLYAIHGAETNAYVARIVNTAEAFFEAPLGVRFEIVKQQVYADMASYPLTETDPVKLLQQFATNPTNPTMLGISGLTYERDVDIKHLFTGRDLDGTPVGIAYIGTVCYQPRSAYGLTQVTSSAGAPYYFAHEVGHNLGARHDLTVFGSIMNPQISIGSVFSQNSINQINEHLSYFGSCVETKMKGPNLARASLSLKQLAGPTSMTIRGKLIYNSEPLPGIEILVKVGAKSYKATTDNAGAYVVTVKNRSVKRGAAIVASTVGGEVESAKGMTMSLRRKR
jgi:hypothetical protein